MKPLVFAWYAQCWVDAGGKRVLSACELRAISNGMVTPTLFSWRPVLVHSRTPCVVFFELCTKQIMNLQCGASVFIGRNAVCRRSLPCVDMADTACTCRRLATEDGVITVEIISATED